MKSRIVPPEELNPEKSLRAEDYVKEPITSDNFLQLTRPMWRRGKETVLYNGCECYNRHSISIAFEFQLPRVTENNTVLPDYSPDRSLVMGLCIALPESRMFDLAPGAELPRWDIPEKVDRFTTEQLHAAHTFKFVEDNTDQMAVCEVAKKLFEGLPNREDHSFIEHLLENYMNTGDEYMTDELVAVFETPIWTGEV